MRPEDFVEKINYVKHASMGVPKIIQINLGTPETDREFSISGNLFYIYSAPDESSYVNIKVNETREPAIPYTVHTGLETPFYKLYITTPAGQAGTMIIIYGTEAPEFLRILDNRSVTVAGVGGVLEELRGDVTPEDWGTEKDVDTAATTPARTEILDANATRKACILQAKSTNAGIVYIGFDATVSTTKWVAELQAGMYFAVDDYRGPLWAVASADNQLVGWGEW